MNTIFSDNIQSLYRALARNNDNIGFRYSLAYLTNDNNARFHRVHYSYPPGKRPIVGLFVEATWEGSSEKVCLAFCSYTFDSDGSQYEIHGKLAYDVKEIYKGHQHIRDFLAVGKIPVADGEYSS